MYNALGEARGWTLVSGLRGGHGHRRAALLCRPGGLEHAGVEACVPAGVLGQVVTPHEALVAQRAVEALLAGVGAVVAGQLVGARELLPTAGPSAFKWTLAGVNP